MKVISYDFDECLDGGPDWVEQAFVADLDAGHFVWICTARYEDESLAVERWLLDRDLIDEVPVIYTGRDLKGPYLAEIGASQHYDDNVKQCESVRRWGIAVVHVAYEG